MHLSPCVREDGQRLVIPRSLAHRILLLGLTMHEESDEREEDQTQPPLCTRLFVRRIQASI